MTTQPTQDAIVTQRAREFARSWFEDEIGKHLANRQEREMLKAHFARFEAEIEAATIERCVGVADSNRTDDDSMWDRAADTIATAIRNLKGQTS